MINCSVYQLEMGHYLQERQCKLDIKEISTNAVKHRNGLPREVVEYLSLVKFSGQIQQLSGMV